MNVIKCLKFAVCSCLFVGCMESNELNVKTEHEKGISVTVPQPEIESENDVYTRSNLSWDGSSSKLKFTWGDGDALAVYSTKSSKSHNIFHMRTGGGTPSAFFTGDGFDLEKGKAYYSIVPTRVTLNGDEVIADDDIVVSYEGQCQKGNDNTDHLGKYDFMAAAAVVQKEGFASFDFTRLSTPVRLVLNGLGGKSFKQFRLVRQDGGKMQYERHLDLTMDQASIDDYKPLYASPVNLDKNSDGTDNDNTSYLLELKNEDGTQGYITLAAEESLVLYMMMPANPGEQEGPFFGILTDTDDKKYYFTWAKTTLKQNIIKQLVRTPIESAKLAINLSIDKKWVHGDSQSQTRAGDPGIEEKLEAPDKLFIYVCKDDKWLLTEEKASQKDKWTDNGSKFDYEEPILIDVEDADPNKLSVYVVASKGEIDRTTNPTTLTKSTTSYTVIENMKSSTTVFTEDLLKNLYSGSAVYVKAGESIPMVDVTLTHVAAKLDVQWNNTTSTALTGNVSINDLPKWGVSLFKPTTVESPATDADKWTVNIPSTPITVANQWNGRAVFYVPQLASSTYNITVGTGAGQNITFHPNTDGFKTSWLKANITIAPPAP